MKCKYCGAKIKETDKFCPGCGAKNEDCVENKEFATLEDAKGQKMDNVVITNKPANQASSTSATLGLIAEIFMILSIVGMFWLIIPLAWLIPMTIHVFNSYSRGTKMSLGFKVCALLFCSLVGGVCLLCDSESTAK